MKTVSHNAYDYLEIDKISLKQKNQKLDLRHYPVSVLSLWGL